MTENLLDTRQLVVCALFGHCAKIARHMKRLFNRSVSPRWVQKQMGSETEILQRNFYGKFLTWLYAIEASTFIGSRMIVADILARFPLEQKTRISPSDFLAKLSLLVGEITALIVTGDKGLLKVKVLEGQLLMQRMAESL